VADLAALKSAARAAIVIPAVFAFADKVIKQPQTSILAAFGSFAILVLVEFGGPPRKRFAAYVGLAFVGAVFITLGTLCSRNPWLAAGAMAVVGFVTLFSGVLGGYFAAAATGAILTFVLPVTIPVPDSAIPDRLEGWGLAAGAGICAVMLLWPPRRNADLQREAARAVRAVADFVDAERERLPELGRLAREAVDGLGRRFLGTQHRPTGPTGPTAALASIPDELDWLLSFLAPSPELPALELSCAEDAEAMAATANVRSVWFQNSVRGAAGLAVAVYIAQRTGLQHSFWVVLGTLSVLRSNALGTGRSIVSALAGTAVGIVVGALLVIAIGTHETVLWGVLPVAILLAACAPRAISFAAGQAGFTVVLFILFNLIQPVGWRVGLIRVEDIAIGFAISLGVGLLFWPRGAGALLRQDVATAYARGADYVVATARQLTTGEDADSAARASRAADAALHRLDDVFRQYLAERSATKANVEDVAALVGGASLGGMVDSDARLAHCGANLDREIHAFQSWYVTLGYTLVNNLPVPPPHLRDAEGRSRLRACVRDAALGREKATAHAALVLLWASQHLDNLWRSRRTLASAHAQRARLRPTLVT
jgi:uncharacterized membrane protein YccC